MSDPKFMLVMGAFACCMSSVVGSVIAATMGGDEEKKITTTLGPSAAATAAEEEEEVEAYELVGPGHCQGAATYSSPAWKLLKPGEPQTRATGFEEDELFKKYLERAQSECDKDPDCKYLSVWKDAGYRTYKEGQCSTRTPGTIESTWKRNQ